MKKNEIKKGNIIIGIGAFAIIAIAIIGVITFFSPKSHAQVQHNDFDKVTVSALNKFNSKPLKDGYKPESFKENHNVAQVTFKVASFAKTFDAFRDKEQFNYKPATFKDEHKAAFTRAFVGAEKFFPAASFVKHDQHNFNGRFSFAKEKRS